MFKAFNTVILPGAWRMLVVFLLILSIGGPAQDTSAASLPSGAVLSLAEPVVNFSRSASMVEEGSGSVILTVNLSAVSSLPVTVDYATSDGTATAGSDYITTNGTLKFAAGITNGYILNGRDFGGLVVTDSPTDRHTAFTWMSTTDETNVYADAIGAWTSVTTDTYPEVTTLAQVPANTYEVWIQQYGGDGNRSLEVTVGENTAVQTDAGSGGLSWQHVGAYALQQDTLIKVKAVGGFVNHGQGYPERRGAFRAIYLTTSLGTTPPDFIADGQTSCPCVNSGLPVSCTALTSQSFYVPIHVDQESELPETFTVSLSSSTNATLGIPASVAVTIVEQLSQVYLPFTRK